MLLRPQHHTHNQLGWWVCGGAELTATDQHGSPVPGLPLTTSWLTCRPLTHSSLIVFPPCRSVVFYFCIPSFPSHSACPTTCIMPWSTSHLDCFFQFAILNCFCESKFVFGSASPDRIKVQLPLVKMFHWRPVQIKLSGENWNFCWHVVINNTNNRLWTWCQGDVFSFSLSSCYINCCQSSCCQWLTDRNAVCAIHM